MMQKICFVLALLLTMLSLTSMAAAQGTSEVKITATQDGAQVVKISTNGGAATNVRLPGSGLVRGTDYFVTGEGTSVVTITFDVPIKKGDEYKFKCDTASSGSHTATVHTTPAGWQGS
jgi:hypothetical protein